MRTTAAGDTGLALVAFVVAAAVLVFAWLPPGGSVVSRRELGAAAWPAGVTGERAVDARLQRLRDRVRPLGLQVHNVRRRGLLLEVQNPPGFDELRA